MATLAESFLADLEELAEDEDSVDYLDKDGDVAVALLWPSCSKMVS